MVLLSLIFIAILINNKYMTNTLKYYIMLWYISGNINCQYVLNELKKLRTILLGRVPCRHFAKRRFIYSGIRGNLWKLYQNSRTNAKDNFEVKIYRWAPHTAVNKFKKLFLNRSLTEYLTIRTHSNIIPIWLSRFWDYFTFRDVQNLTLFNVLPCRNHYVVKQRNNHVTKGAIFRNRPDWLKSALTTRLNCSLRE